MDINCTHSCAHQREGKCTLRELEHFAMKASRSKTDCPYYFARNTPKDIIA